MQPELVPYLLYEPEESGILWIKFNQPETLNALLPDTPKKVAEYMRAGDEDPKIRVIVLTGVGRGFCSGGNMKRPTTTNEQVTDQGIDHSRQNFIYHYHPYWRVISDVMKPTIAMVNGPAVGGGMDMALHCDLRIGCERTRFYSYHNAPQIIENGGNFFLPHIVGLGRALQLMLMAEFIEAPQAYEWGLLNKLVPSEKLEEETRAICTKLINAPPLAQWLGKRIMRRALSSTLEATLELCAHSSVIMSHAEDRFEARTAWREKRTPVFKGR